MLHMFSLNLYEQVQTKIIFHILITTWEKVRLDISLLKVGSQSASVPSSPFYKDITGHGVPPIEVCPSFCIYSRYLAYTFPITGERKFMHFLGNGSIWHLSLLVKSITSCYSPNIVSLWTVYYFTMTATNWTIVDVVKGFI